MDESNKLNCRLLLESQKQLELMKLVEREIKDHSQSLFVSRYPKKEILVQSRGTQHHHEIQQG
jgi:hypothetical protein